jgi:hypothetical protein
VTSVTCTGAGSSGANYVLTIAEGTDLTGQTLQGDLSKDGNSVFQGTLELLGQGLFVDSAGNKYETNRYWSAPSDVMRVEVLENSLLKVNLQKPETINAMSCLLGDGILRKTDAAILDPTYASTEDEVSESAQSYASTGDSGGPAFISINTGPTKLRQT